MLQDDQLRELRLVSELAGKLARELSDPVSVVLGRLELLQAVERMEPENVQRHVSAALAHARRLATTLTNMRLVGQFNPDRAGRCLISEVLDESMELLVHELKRVAISVELEPADLDVVGHSALFGRVVADLIKRQLDESVSRSFWFEGRAVGKQASLRLLFGEKEAVAVLREVGHGEQSSATTGLLVARAILASTGGRLDEFRSEGLHCFDIYLPR